MTSSAPKGAELVVVVRQHADRAHRHDATAKGVSQLCCTTEELAGKARPARLDGDEHRRLLPRARGDGAGGLCDRDIETATRAKLADQLGQLILEGAR
jgi:hypothetical protein